MKPIRIRKPGQTQFERMAQNEKRKQAFRDLIKAKGKPKK